MPLLPLGEAAAAAFPRWEVDEEQARLSERRPAAHAAPESRRRSGRSRSSDLTGSFMALVEERQGRAKSLAVFA